MHGGISYGTHARVRRSSGGGCGASGTRAADALARARRATRLARGIMTAAPRFHPHVHTYGTVLPARITRPAPTVPPRSPSGNAATPPAPRQQGGPRACLSRADPSCSPPPARPGAPAGARLGSRPGAAQRFADGRHVLALSREPPASDMTAPSRLRIPPALPHREALLGEGAARLESRALWSPSGNSSDRILLWRSAR